MPNSAEIPIPIDIATVWMLNHRQVYLTDRYGMHRQQRQSSFPGPGWLALLWEFKCNRGRKEKRNDGGKYVLYQPNIVSRVAIKTTSNLSGAPLCSCHPLIIIKLSTWLYFVDQMLTAHLLRMCLFSGLLTCSSWPAASGLLSVWPSTSVISISRASHSQMLCTKPAASSSWKLQWIEPRVVSIHAIPDTSYAIVLANRNPMLRGLVLSQSRPVDIICICVFIIFYALSCLLGSPLCVCPVEYQMLAVRDVPKCSLFDQRVHYEKAFFEWSFCKGEAPCTKLLRFQAPMIVVEEMGWDDSCCMRKWHLQRSQLRAGQDLWVQEIQIGRDGLFYRHSGTGKWRWIVNIRFSIGMQTRSMSHVQIVWPLSRSDAARLCIVEALSLQRLWVDGLQASVFIVPRWQHQRLTPTRNNTPLITTHPRLARLRLHLS